MDTPAMVAAKSEAAMGTATLVIVDCFTFLDELDMLECRLVELSGRVDYFVLVESRSTFQGGVKRLWYWGYRDRYTRWNHKIVPVIADLSGSDAWLREASQRAAMKIAVDGIATSTDTIIVSDVDEIWRADTDLTLDDGPILVLELANYVYNLGLQHPDVWSGPVVTSKSTLDGMESEPYQTLRGCRLHPRPPRRRNAGWHLSWFGGLDACKNKLAAFSHTELAHINLEQLQADQLHVDGTPLIPVTTRDVPGWVADGHAPKVWG